MRGRMGVLAAALALAVVIRGGLVPREAERRAEPPEAAVSEAAGKPEAPPPDGETEPPEAEKPAEGVPPAVPEPLAGFLDRAGLTPDGLDAGQLIVAASDGTSASLYGFARDGDGQWSQALGPASGHTGKNGVTASKAEGDKATPSGLYRLPFAFGIQPDPGCALEYRQVTERSRWVDDPDSAFYNQWVEDGGAGDWDSAEHLIDYPVQYAYALAIGYNEDPVVPGAGSAIFLHCGSNPTLGCISTSQETVLQILRWLDPSRSPKILIL